MIVDARRNPQAAEESSYIFSVFTFWNIKLKYTQAHNA